MNYNYQLCVKKNKRRHSLSSTQSARELLLLPLLSFRKCRTEEILFFLFVHMGQHKDILAAVTSAICTRQHSSFPLLMAPEEPEVRILWAVTLNWVRYSGFSSWLVFNIYVRIWASSLSFSFSSHPGCIACLDRVLRSHTGVFEQCKKEDYSL